MKKETIFWLLFIVLILVFAANNIRIKMDENKKIPVQQTVSEAFITVKAPPLERNTKNEDEAKAALGKNLTDICFFQSSHKGTDYTLIYAKYAKEVNLESGIKSVINLFKDNNFIYEIKENEINGNTGAYIEGTFDKDGKTFGIKEQLIKRGTDFWQILTIFPYNEKTDALASEYIQSVNLSDNAVNANADTQK